MVSLSIGFVLRLPLCVVMYVAVDGRKKNGVAQVFEKAVGRVSYLGGHERVRARGPSVSL